MTELLSAADVVLANAFPGNVFAAPDHSDAWTDLGKLNLIEKWST